MDWDTSSVLILENNDGDFTDEIVHPRNKLIRVYVARVKGLANKRKLASLTRCVTIDGKRPENQQPMNSKVDEKNRQLFN